MCSNLEFVIIYSEFYSQNFNICYHWNFPQTSHDWLLIPVDKCAVFRNIFALFKVRIPFRD